MSRLDIVMELLGSQYGYRGENTARAVRRHLSREISGGLRTLSAADGDAPGPWFSGWFQVVNRSCTFTPERSEGQSVPHGTPSIHVDGDSAVFLARHDPEPDVGSTPPFIAQSFYFYQIASKTQSIEIAIRESDIEWLSTNTGIALPTTGAK